MRQGFLCNYKHRTSALKLFGSAKISVHHGENSGRSHPSFSGILSFSVKYFVLVVIRVRIVLETALRTPPEGSVNSRSKLREVPGGEHTLKSKGLLFALITYVNM